MPTKPPAKKAPAKKAPAKKTAAKRAPAKPHATVTTGTQAPVRASVRALSAFEEKFTKRFGAGSLQRARKRGYEVVSTGSISLDIALGSGGWVVGRIAEVWGPESVSKTTLVLCSIANFQRRYPTKMAALVDMEHSFDPEWAEANGVDLDRLFVAWPHDSEDVSDMCRMMIESQLYSIVALDSIGGMISAAEMQKDAADEVMGRPAKIITRMIKQCAVLCDETQTTLIVVNQTRDILNGQGGEQSAGPKALRHATTHKVRLRRTNDDPYYVGTGENRELVGFVVGAIVEKNKVAPPRRTANYALFNQTTHEFGPVGIDRAREAFQVAKRLGLIEEASTGRYLLPGQDKAIHGMPATLAFLREHPDMLDKLRIDMLARLNEQVVIAEEVPIDSVEESVEITPQAEGGVLDFSGRTSADADVKALDQLRDNALSEAVAGAR